MTARKVHAIRKKQPQPIIDNSSSKNHLMGLGGFAMIILTNYQAEIKNAISLLLGLAK
jgi:hypothetical protein